MYKNIINDIFIQEFFVRTLLYLIPFFLISFFNIVKKDSIILKILKKIIYITTSFIFILLALDQSDLDKILK